MMSDLPKPPPGVKTKTYADDVTVYTTAKTRTKPSKSSNPTSTDCTNGGRNGALNSKQKNPPFSHSPAHEKIPKTCSYSSMAGAFPRRQPQSFLEFTSTENFPGKPTSMKLYPDVRKRKTYSTSSSTINKAPAYTHSLPSTKQSLEAKLTTAS